MPSGKYALYFQPCGGNSGDYLGETYPHQLAVKAGQTTRLNVVLALASSISGTVTDTSAAPIAGICVVADGANVGSQSATNSEGKYTVPGLPAGRYQVQFTGGCGNKGSYAPQFYDDQQIVPTSVTVAAGTSLTGIDAALQPGATITGKVTSQSGSALPRICVSATTPQSFAGAGQTPIGLLLDGLGVVPGVAAGLSGPTGRYRIANLSPGQYGISFAGCSKASRNYAAQWFQPGSTTGGPAWVSVGAGEPIEASARMLPAGSITGVIRSTTGAPLRGICAVPLGLNGQVPRGGPLIAALTGGGSSLNGHYLIRGLAAGQYRVEFLPCNGQAYATTWYKHAGDQRSATTITVTSGHAVTGIDPVMSAGQQVSGQVSSGITKRPVAVECVGALDSSGDLQRLVSTHGNGRFLIKHLLPGHYELAFFSCLRSSPLASEQVPITVTAAKPVIANLTLPKAGMITGTVDGGDPVRHAPAICAEAVPATGSGLQGLGRTGAWGQYQIVGLAPGKYRIEFTGNCPVGVGGFAPQWFNGQSAKAKADVVRVAAGAVSTGVDATLAADGGISGTVEVSGTPTAQVCAIAFPAGGGLPVLAPTAANGSYQLDGLTPGHYTVEFSAGCGVSSYHTQWFDGAATQAAATPVQVHSGTITAMIDAH